MDCFGFLLKLIFGFIKKMSRTNFNTSALCPNRTRDNHSILFMTFELLSKQYTHHTMKCPTHHHKMPDRFSSQICKCVMQTVSLHTQIQIWNALQYEQCSIFQLFFGKNVTLLRVENIARKRAYNTHSSTSSNLICTRAHYTCIVFSVVHSSLHTAEVESPTHPR